VEAAPAAPEMAPRAFSPDTEGPEAQPAPSAAIDPATGISTVPPVAIEEEGVLSGFPSPSGSRRRPSGGRRRLPPTEPTERPTERGDPPVTDGGAPEEPMHAHGPEMRQVVPELEEEALIPAARARRRERSAPGSGHLKGPNGPRGVLDRWIELRRGLLSHSKLTCRPLSRTMCQ
jgi:hypothetical protein